MFPTQKSLLNTLLSLILCFVPFLLRLFVESVEYVCHDIAVEGVAVGLGAALGIEVLGETAELAEDVEAVDGEGEAGLEESLAESCVPYEVVSVGGTAGISAAGVHGEVGGELHLPGQRKCRVKAIVEIVEVYIVEVFTPGGATPISYMASCPYPEESVYPIVEV